MRKFLNAGAALQGPPCLFFLRHPDLLANWPPICYDSHFLSEIQNERAGRNPPLQSRPTIEGQH